MKRIFDIIFSGIVLLLFLPFGLLLSLAIILESRGGIFFRQMRIGQNEKPFALLKFRSMQVNAEYAGKITVGSKDPRITRVGYYLRKFKLDEFPQFINVLKGDMSIVGPRPEVKEYVDLYTDEQRKILLVKPGITDYASLAYFRENELLSKAENPQETYIKEIMPAKIALNEKYISNPSIGKDILIILKTMAKIFRA